jgi:hypothetical protein
LNTVDEEREMKAIRPSAEAPELLDHFLGQARR